MELSNKKLIKKNFVMLSISLVLIISALLAYYFHFYAKDQTSETTISAEQFLNQTELPAGDDNEKLQNPETKEEVDYEDNANLPAGSLDFSIFNKKTFLLLKDYSILVNLNKQEKIITQDEDIPPMIESVTIDDPGIGGRLNIFWKKVDSQNIAKVRIYRFKDEADKGEIIAELDNSRDFYVDKNLMNDHVYYYLVKNVSKKDIESKNTAKSSGMATNIIPPASPTGISVRQVDNEIELSWTNPPDEDLAYIYVYRSENQTFLGDLVAQITAFPNKKHSLTDKNVESYKEYNYTLIAVDNAGNKSSYNLIKYGNNDLFIKKEIAPQQSE